MSTADDPEQSSSEEIDDVFSRSDRRRQSWDETDEEEASSADEINLFQVVIEAVVIVVVIIGFVVVIIVIIVVGKRKLLAYSQVYYKSALEEHKLSCDNENCGTCAIQTSSISDWNEKFRLHTQTHEAQTHTFQLEESRPPPPTHQVWRYPRSISRENPPGAPQGKSLRH